MNTETTSTVETAEAKPDCAPTGLLCGVNLWQMSIEFLIVAFVLGCVGEHNDFNALKQASSILSIIAMISIASGKAKPHNIRR